MVKWETKMWNKEKKYSTVEFICDECGILKIINIQSAKDKKSQLCIECFLVSKMKVEAGIQARKTKPTLKGIDNPNYKGKQEFVCLCGNHFFRRVSPSQENTKYHTYCSTKCKKKYSVSKAKYFEYKEHVFRSSWELAFAQYLDNEKYVSKYEPESFETSYGFYTPDFWVEDFNSYVEIKGFFRDKEAKGKFEEFSKSHSIVLADMEYLLSLGFVKIKSGLKKGQLCPPTVQS